MSEIGEIPTLPYFDRASQEVDQYLVTNGIEAEEDLLSHEAELNALLIRLSDECPYRGDGLTLRMTANNLASVPLDDTELPEFTLEICSGTVRGRFCGLRIASYSTHDYQGMRLGLVLMTVSTQMPPEVPEPSELLVCTPLDGHSRVTAIMPEGLN